MAMLGRMSFGCFVAVLLGLFMVAACRLCMVSGLLVVAGLVAISGRAMMLGGLGMMFRSFAVMLCSFFRHRKLLG
jgi:hypothetical protein